MGLLTIQKLKAARMLASMTQEELAAQSGISPSSVKRYESGATGALSEKSQDAILRTFLANGIEIGDNHLGYVRNTLTYEGKEGFAKFFDDVYNTVKNGGNVCVSNVREDYFLKWEDARADFHTKRMAAINNLDFKVLIEEGDTNFAGSDYVEYRALPADKFSDIPLYIYGDKAAILVFREDSVEIFVIQHHNVAMFFRERFAEAWKIAKPIT